MEKLENYQKYVSIITDEMKIKESLDFDKHNRCFTGFTMMGDINDHVSLLQNCSPQLATKAFAIMVRGIFVKFNFPFASQLFPYENVKVVTTLQ